jgi:hypothetical protein
MMEVETRPPVSLKSRVLTFGCCFDRIPIALCSFGDQTIREGLP